MTADESDLRDTARSLAWLHQLLDDRKYAPTPPPSDGRPMQQTFGPGAPAPVWTLDAEDRLLEERQELDEFGRDLPQGKIIPGGLRNLVVDAAAHVGEPVRHPADEVKLKGQKLRAVEMCDFTARRAQQICMDFPVAEDLLALMQEQARWLAARLTPSQTAPDSGDTFLTMGSAQRSLAAKGLSCPEGTIRRWASEGLVATSVRDDRRRTYRLADVLDQLERRTSV